MNLFWWLFIIVVLGLFFVYFVSGILVKIVVVRILNFMLKGSNINFLWKKWVFLCIMVIYDKFKCCVWCVVLDFIIILLLRIVVFN